MYKLLHHTTTKFYLERTWIGMGKTCEPKAFSFKCMTKFTTNKKKKKRKKEHGHLGFHDDLAQGQTWDWFVQLIPRMKLQVKKR